MVSIQKKHVECRPSRNSR